MPGTRQPVNVDLHPPFFTTGFNQPGVCGRQPLGYRLIFNNANGLLMPGNNYKTLISHFMALSFAFIFECSFGFSLRPLYALAIYLLLVSIASNAVLFRSAVIILGLTSSLYAPVSFLYGSPNINILLSLSETNLAEGLEFITTVPLQYYGFSACIILISWILIMNRQRLIIRRQKMAGLFCLGIILFRPVLGVAQGNSLDIDFTPVKFIKKIHHSVVTIEHENDALMALMNMKTTLKPTKASDDFDTYIVVIGESMRRDMMQDNGFFIDNTPFMSSAKGTVFRHYIAAASSTQTSLSTSFTVTGQPQNNLITLAKAQGLETWWISNQGSHGNDDSRVSLIGKQSDRHIFLKKGEYDAINHDDNELLPFVESASQDNEKKKLIVIHLMGSHPNFCTRTAGKREYDYLNKDMSCYVQSIKNTDDFLRAVAQLENKAGKKWAMMYFSDHGLSFANKDNRNAVTLLHGDKYKQNYDVPLFFTSYNATQRLVKTSPWSAMDFLSLYLDWTGSSEKTLSRACSPLTTRDCRTERVRVLDFDHNPVYYSTLSDDPLL